jgi:hypothetical protein
MKKIVILAVAATIAGVGFAAAQTGTGSTAVDPNKCWDVSSNTIKDKSMGTGSSTTGSAASGATAGSTPSGSAGSTAGSAGTSTGTPKSPSAAVRPAGMPSC